VNVNAKFTIKCELGISQRLAIFAAVCLTRCGIDQDARTFNFFRLVGMQNRNLIELSIEGPGTLAGHQGYVAVALLGQKHFRSSR